jgi:hypothetical protein
VSVFDSSAWWFIGINAESALNSQYLMSMVSTVFKNVFGDCRIPRWSHRGLVVERAPAVVHGVGLVLAIGLHALDQVILAAFHAIPTNCIQAIQTARVALDKPCVSSAGA